jgi:tetratricopeptide (TPR) repeat protein
MSRNTNDAEQWFQEGIRHAELREYDNAIECFGKTFEIDPMHFDAWFNKVTLLAYREKYEKAMEYVEKTSLSESVQALAAKAIVLYHKASVRNDEESHEKAMEYVERIREYVKIQKSSESKLDAVASLHANLKFDLDPVETLHAKVDLFSI